MSKVVAVLAESRHHNASLDGRDNVLRQHFRCDLDLQFSSVTRLAQDARQEVRPLPKDFPYQLSNSVICVAQFQSGIAKESAADELSLALLLIDRVEKVRHPFQGAFTFEAREQESREFFMSLRKNGYAQLFLAGKMKVQVPLLHPGGLDDSVDAGAAVAPFIDQSSGCFEHSGFRLFAF